MHKRCIFPGCTSPADSLEHVVLSSLGGRLRLRGVFCKHLPNGTAGHNNLLGAVLDGPITEAFRPFSTFLNVAGDRPRRRTTGPALRNVPGSDGEQYTVEGGGLPVLSKNRVDVSELPAGGRRVTIQARPGDSHRMLEGQLTRFGVEGADSGQVFEAPRVVRHRSYPELEINLSVGGPEQFRAVAKMALALVAGRTSLVHDHPEAFEEALRFMSEGQGPPGEIANHHYVSALPSPATAMAPGRFDHTVTVCGRAGRLLVGFVEIYGHFRFSVILSRSAPATTSLHYRVNPLTGEDEELNGFPFEQDTCDSATTHAFDRAAILAAYHAAWGEVQRRGRDERIDEIIEGGLDLMRQHEGEVFTPELADRVVRQISEGVTRYLYRLSEEEDVTQEYFPAAPEAPPPAS